LVVVSNLIVCLHPSNLVSGYCSHINSAIQRIGHESPSSLVKHRWYHCTKAIMGQWHRKMSKMMKRKHTA